MNTNDIFRRLRYVYNLSDDKMITLFHTVGYETTRKEISEWLKKEDAPDFEPMDDLYLSHFLNGLIILKRGKKDDRFPIPETSLNNNIVFRKLKIAHALKDSDVLEIMQLADLRMSKHELSAFFRKPTHKNYRKCKDQILRNFIRGLQVKFRPTPEENDKHSK